MCTTSQCWHVAWLDVGNDEFDVAPMPSDRNEGFPFYLWLFLCGIHWSHLRPFLLLLRSLVLFTSSMKYNILFTSRYLRTRKRVVCVCESCERECGRKIYASKTHSSRAPYATTERPPLQPNTLTNTNIDTYFALAFLHTSTLFHLRRIFAYTQPIDVTRYWFLLREHMTR